jgi:glycosyltransferase involved in cell wall biosynthesis
MLVRDCSPATTPLRLFDGLHPVRTASMPAAGPDRGDGSVLETHVACNLPTWSAENVDVSLVIPAYNEELRLLGTLNHILIHMGGQPLRFELLVVDDGSTDRTAEVVSTLTLHDARIRLLREPHRGKGAAVRAGALAAAGRCVIFCDADLSYSVSDLTRLVALLDDAPVVIGSREVEGARRADEPGYRHHMGRAFNLVVRALAVPGIRDTQCGLKCFSREAARRLFSLQTVNGFGFDVEVLFLARKLGYRIVEAPIAWHHVSGSKVDPLRDAMRMFGDVLRVRLNDIRGRYDPVRDLPDGAQPPDRADDLGSAFVGSNVPLKVEAR